MPNWCSVNIEIVGPTAQLSELQEIVNSDADAPFLQTICPAPSHDDYTYDWCVENWGTKWDIQGSDCSGGLEELATAHPVLQSKLTMATATAWSPPLEALKTFQEANPGVIVKCWYYEPGMDFAGIWKQSDDESEDVYIDDLHADSIVWTAGAAKELDDQFGICEEQAQYDDEYDDEEEFDSTPTGI